MTLEVFLPQLSSLALDSGDWDPDWEGEAGINERALLTENLSVHSNCGDPQVWICAWQVPVLAEQLLVCCGGAGGSAPLLEGTGHCRRWHGHQPGRPASPACLFIAPGVSQHLPLMPGSRRAGELIKAQPDGSLTPPELLPRHHNLWGGHLPCGRRHV